MADVIYTTVPGKIKPLLNKIKSVGVPTKVSSAWLKSIGFTSSNDTSLINVLKAIGFIDGSQSPTERWQKYRGSNGAVVLAEGIRAGYNDLYTVYPDAHVQPNASLEHVFNTSSKVGRQAILKAIATFTALAGEAKFENEGEGESNTKNGEANVARQPSTADGIKPASASLASGPTLHIDIQVHISSEASANQIDQIFSSMAKHLFSKND